MPSPSEIAETDEISVAATTDSADPFRSSSVVMETDASVAVGPSASATSSGVARDLEADPPGSDSPVGVNVIKETKLNGFKVR